MKQTKNVTLSLRADVKELLEQYAHDTRQSQSRAVSELIIAAALNKQKGVTTEHGETGEIKKS